MTTSLLGLLRSNRRASALVEPVRDALAHGADVTERDEYGLTPLHHAVWRHEAEAVELARMLIAAGTDVNAVGTANVPPLHLAVASNDTDPPAAIAASLELLEVLGTAGARPAPWATLADFSCCARVIFDRLAAIGLSPMARNATGDQAIHAVIAAGRPALVEALIELGVPLDEPSGLGRSPLGLALRVDPNGHTIANQAAIVALLQARGAPRTIALAPSSDPLWPTSVDIDGLRAAVDEAQVGRSIMRGLARDIVSAQELVASVMDHGEPHLRVELYRQVRAFAAKRDVELVGDVELKRPVFVNGDLVVRGNLDISAPLAVTGRLVVQGVIRDAGNDSWVTVVEGLDCMALYSSGEFAVGGTIAASDVVLGYYNDFTLHADTIRATVVIEDEHGTSAQVEAGLHFDIDRYRQGFGDGVSAALQALFVPEVFDAEGQLDNHAVFQRLARGERLYRWPETASLPDKRAWFRAQLEEPARAEGFLAQIARRELGA